jgi:hypothetical protein
MYRHSLLGPAFAMLLLPWLAGCGDEGFTLAPMSGRVTIDGQPVAGLRISSEPIGGSHRPLPGPDSISTTDADGRYSLYTTDAQRRGAVVGPSRIRIWSNPAETLSIVTDDRDPNYDPAAEINAIKAQMRGGRKKSQQKVVQKSGMIPLRFNDKTNLTFDVPPEGTDKADFDISWK